MTDTPRETREGNDGDGGTTDEKSDLKVVLQFFIVPLALVAVLVLVFFGLQILRSHRPDAEATLDSLKNYQGFLARVVGDLKRWQYGYDLSVLMRDEDAEMMQRILPEIIDGFRDAGERGDLKLRRYLALALGLSADPKAAAALREGLRDDDSQTRLYSVWGLARIDDPSVSPDLRAAVTDTDPGVRKLSVYALGQRGDRKAVPALRAALVDPEEDVRWNSALALAMLRDAAGAQVLMGLLEHAINDPGPTGGSDGGTDPVELALNAIRGLAILAPHEAKGLLRRAAEGDVDPRVAEAARLALDSYGGDDADIP